MDKFCSNCGNQLSIEDKFCNKCGKPISSSSYQNSQSNNMTLDKFATKSMMVGKKLIIFGIIGVIIGLIGWFQATMMSGIAIIPIPIMLILGIAGLLFLIIGLSLYFWGLKTQAITDIRNSLRK